jgi:hypothetical protein
MEDEVGVSSQFVKNISPLELNDTDVEKLSIFVPGRERFWYGQRHVTKMIKQARNMP